MSRASEWAQAPTWPRLDLVAKIGPVHEAYPVLYPSCLTCCIKVVARGERIELLPDEALALARWILDTFGD